jgi:hypothetical protein
MSNAAAFYILAGVSIFCVVVPWLSFQRSLAWAFFWPAIIVVYAIRGVLEIFDEAAR